MIRYINKLFKYFFNRSPIKIRIVIYKLRKRMPWDLGYNEYKWEYISELLNSIELMNNFKSQQLIGFGIGLDERVVEYPWIISNLSDNTAHLLDAGSTFNYSEILEVGKIRKKKITIYTYHPERNNYNAKGISYIYGDLRALYFNNGTFDEIVCQSTIEHIGMNNSLYGWKESNKNITQSKNYDYIIVVEELIRVLKTNGILLLTFPYGKFEHHGFLQQFDTEMYRLLLERINRYGNSTVVFFRYMINGWSYSSQSECEECTTYNPHTGIGKGIDNAAHSRGICCIKFVKGSK